MAYTTIDDPSAYFQIATYTGDGNDDRAITNDGNSNLQPDLIWFKNRSTTNQHNLLDSTRGVTKRLRPDDDSAEATVSTRLKSFDSDGMTISTDPSVNGDGNSIVAWQWKANGGTTTTNDASATGVGSIDSVYQANTTAGFSIVTYTGTGSAGTIAHGLGVKPSVIIIKARTEPTGGVHFGSDQGNWIVYHQGTASDPETDLLLLNENNAVSDSTGHMNDTAPTTSVFTINTNVDVNESSDTYVAYCFAEKQGYSKFGNYTGNGNADGAFVYLGFKPALIIVKATDTDNWRMYDHKRANAHNVIDVRIIADDNAAESQDDNECDFLSNGVKFRSSSGGVNSSGQAYTYMAWAEHPFVSSKGVPVTAR